MDSLQVKELSLEEMMPLIQEHLSRGQTVRFSPRGISMLPMLRQGVDSVVLAPAPEALKKYDIPLYQRPNGQYILHRVVNTDGTYTCIGDNQFQYENDVHHEWVLAVVTAFYRGGQYWSVEDWRYRIYCRLWHYSRLARHFWRRGIRWLRRHLKSN